MNVAGLLWSWSWSVVHIHSFKPQLIADCEHERDQNNTILLFLFKSELLDPV